MDPHNSVVSRGLAVVSTTALALGLSACSGVSRRDQNTAAGAGAGAVGGAILTNGSTLSTQGGAAVGRVIGNRVEPKR
jgi:osmotically inducible lipoprotein OsmB